MAASIDLDAISAEFLTQCGACDAGLLTACTCSQRDFRPVMLDLVREVERYRDTLAALAADCESMPDEQVTPLMFAATATRIRLILAGKHP